MKKILLLFSTVGLLTLSSCNNDDNFDSDTIAEVFEIPNVTFTAAGDYTILYDLNPSIPEADMILVYRLVQEANANMDVWELTPITKYNAGGVDGAEIDYRYNFTQVDIEISMDGNVNLAEFPEYTQNQVFRVVVIPGYASNFRGSASAMEGFKDYNATIKKYGIDDSNIKQLTAKQ
jgi:hypothetical protein